MIAIFMGAPLILDESCDSRIEVKFGVVFEVRWEAKRDFTTDFMNDC